MGAGKRLNEFKKGGGWNAVAELHRKDIQSIIFEQATKMDVRGKGRGGGGSESR